VSKYRPRYYRPGLVEFGCGTDEIQAELVPEIAVHPPDAPKFEPLTIKWTDFMC
jgi:hypothetical protein